MTQNQIAYWANIERERSNRRNEEIASAKQEVDELKAKHDIVQGYMSKTPGFAATKIAAGKVIAQNLGVEDPYTAGKRQLKSSAKRIVKNIVDNHSVVDVPKPVSTAKSNKSTSGGSFGARR